MTTIISFRSPAKAIVLICSICTVLFAACKKETTKQTETPFDYTIDTPTCKLYSFPITKDVAFALTLKSGTAQDVHISIKMPEGFSFNYKDSVRQPGQTANGRLSYSKLVLPGTYPYTIETSSTGTKSKIFTGSIIVPNEDCAKDFKGAFKAKETYRSPSGVDSVKEYTVNLVQDPVFTNFMTLENFRNDPAQYAKLVFQCHVIQGPFSTPPACYLYETNFPHSIRMYHTQHTGLQFVLAYDVIRDGEKIYTCSTIFEKL